MNKEVIIDARDKDCPLPLIILKKSLTKNEKGFIFLINNQIARENIFRFLKDNKIAFKFEKINDLYKIFIKPPKNHSIKNLKKEISIQNSKTINLIGRHVVCISSNKMGQGSDELGQILLNAFINNLIEIYPLPSAIIFYNSGIMLTLKNSPTTDMLQTLESSGVKIFTCGACIDYFNVKDKISTGYISNMHEISDILTNASHIIYP